MITQALHQVQAGQEAIINELRRILGNQQQQQQQSGFNSDSMAQTLLGLFQSYQNARQSAISQGLGNMLNSAAVNAKNAEIANVLGQLLLAAANNGQNNYGGGGDQERGVLHSESYP